MPQIIIDLTEKQFKQMQKHFQSEVKEGDCFDLHKGWKQRMLPLMAASIKENLLQGDLFEEMCHDETFDEIMYFVSDKE